MATKIIIFLLILLAFFCMLDPLTLTRDEESNRSNVKNIDGAKAYKPLFYHKGSTVFRHQSLRRKYYDEIGGYELTTKDPIAFGTFLAVEFPLLEPDADILRRLTVIEAMEYIGKMVREKQAKDLQFSKVWNAFDVNKVYFESLKQILVRDKPTADLTLEDLDNLAHLSTLSSNQIKMHPNAIYSILGRINFGLPANVAAIIGDKEDGYICILIATKDFEPDEQMVIDYFYDWDDRKLDEQRLLRQQEKNNGLGYVKGLNKNWQRIGKLVKRAGKSEQKQMRLLYSNGIVGKEGGKKLKISKGCNGMSAAQCEVKHNIRESVDSGQIFKIALDKINVDGEGMPEEDGYDYNDMLL